LRKEAAAADRKETGNEKGEKQQTRKQKKEKKERQKKTHP
jgi:hypothetical protein